MTGLQSAGEFKVGDDVCHETKGPGKVTFIFSPTFIAVKHPGDDQAMSYDITRGKVYKPVAKKEVTTWADFVESRKEMLQGFDKMRERLEHLAKNGPSPYDSLDATVVKGLASFVLVELAMPMPLSQIEERAMTNPLESM